MISVEEARRLVFDSVRPCGAETVALVDSLGRTLAEEVASDIDSPPYDKSLVDGYALVTRGLETGAELELLEEVTAGAVPTRAVGPGQATAIMTGAPIPDGADAVVMVEQTTKNDAANRVTVHSPPPAGRNILRRGVSMRAGEKLLRPGHAIRPCDIGLLGEVGRDKVRVFRPRLAVLATGDELVDVAQRPGPGQIRNSNGPMLVALGRSAGAEVHDLGVALDRPEELRRLISLGLQADALVLSGGVSAGVLDLVPAILEELGVRNVFHKVRLKPGKPLWFGLRDSGDDRTLVFGLPGNPLSGFVCFELFVRPALSRACGAGDVERDVMVARLAEPCPPVGDRETWRPARLSREGAGWRIATIPWQGSADLRSLAAANALAHFLPGDRPYVGGETIEAIRLR